MEGSPLSTTQIKPTARASFFCQNFGMNISINETRAHDPAGGHRPELPCAHRLGLQTLHGCACERVAAAAFPPKRIARRSPPARGDASSLRAPRRI